MAEQEFRQQCLQAFTDHNALDFMFEQCKNIALKEEWNVAENGNDPEKQEN
jgi:CRISP-associated protein Cas1